MNKTIIININGIVFHIEEDAYEVLKAYMTNVKLHFANSADSLEITTDIENRIAEMFSEILANENKQVIVEQDVNTVIEQMGRVEDFEVFDDNQASNTYKTGERRLFRDPDDHLISGVCAGIANYFDIQPVWIRLAFAVSFLFAGSGLLLYIILWIVVPKALTRSDRMAMRGEKLNLQGFKNNLQEELSSVRGHLDNLHKEARPFIYQLRDFITDLVHHLGLFFNGAGKILVKLIGLAVLIACFGAAIAMVVGLVAFVGFGQARYNHLFPFSIIENQHAVWIYISAFLSAFIPVLTLILVILSAVFNTRPITRSTATTILVVWIGALCVLIFYAARAASDFRERSSFSETINLKQTADNVYHLKLNDIKYLTHDDSIRYDIKDQFHDAIIKNTDYDNGEPGNVNISIERSDSDQPELVEVFSAQGPDYESALMNARNTTYRFTQKDSTLVFDSRLLRKDGENWHNEELSLTLKLPLNAKVIVDQELNDHLPINLSVYDCNETNKTDRANSAIFVITNDGPQCKVDTVVVVKTPKQLDSARLVNKNQTIARLKAQIDSVNKADSLRK